MIALSKSKWIWYFLLVSLIFAANSALYYSPVYDSVPSLAVWGSVFDLMFMIPLLTYLLILRRRYPFKYLGGVVLACYLLANLVIPSQHMQQITMFSYLIIAFESIFVCLELYILFTIIVKLPRIISSFRSNNTVPYFYTKAINAYSDHLSVNRMAEVLLSEMSLFYYALFSWRKKVPEAADNYFTYHKNSSVITIYIMLIHATVLETVGLHYLLHEWNVIISWGILGLNAYGVLFFIGEINAIRLSPFIIQHKRLYMQVGLTKSAVIPFDSIEQLRTYEGPEKLSKSDQKRTMDATVKDIFNNKPSLEIVLREKIVVRYMYGFKKSVDRILLNVDNDESFRTALTRED
ncbi:hypothetical protein CFK37_01615 [Virgibacillus phasianinus]|uniref:Beta-carotene 15,15'-monooxygenase n=1 Tax=Virgibacillus phasianinus TaxID=2017483 RepID=A0A220TZ14_9BACI|nr:hypothetical protein [Virgibacillus phasianinus]ASK61000.1 hypothetical protein CFK37_01615 [Virgibacillus phasianinus]